jgi:hypothetical protein
MNQHFTLAELNKISEQLAKGQGRPVTEDEAIAVMRWANMSRMGFAMLELVLKGQIIVKVENGELSFMSDPGYVNTDTLKDVEAFLGIKKR